VHSPLQIRVASSIGDGEETSPHASAGRQARDHRGGVGLDRPCASLCQEPLVAASYCSMMLAGMRPRSLTAIP
jgi:hypothetical protein